MEIMEILMKKFINQIDLLGLTAQWCRNNKKDLSFKSVPRRLRRFKRQIVQSQSVDIVQEGIGVSNALMRLILDSLTEEEIRDLEKYLEEPRAFSSEADGNMTITFG